MLPNFTFLKVYARQKNDRLTDHGVCLLCPEWSIRSERKTDLDTLNRKSISKEETRKIRSYSNLLLWIAKFSRLMSKSKQRNVIYWVISKVLSGGYFFILQSLTTSKMRKFQTMKYFLLHKAKAFQLFWNIVESRTKKWHKIKLKKISEILKK